MQAFWGLDATGRPHLSCQPEGSDVLFELNYNTIKPTPQGWCVTAWSMDDDGHQVELLDAKFFGQELERALIRLVCAAETGSL